MREEVKSTTRFEASQAGRKVRDPDEISEWGGRLALHFFAAGSEMYYQASGPRQTEMPPGYKLEGRLMLDSAMCFYSALLRGEHWAKHDLTKKVSTAIDDRVARFEGRRVHFRDQIFGQMHEALHEVVRLDFGKTVGQAVADGELDLQHVRYCLNIMSCALDMHIRWLYMRRENAEAGADATAE